MPYDIPMLTVAESEIFSRYVSDYWTEDEREAFSVWIAEHYNVGDVVCAALAVVAKYAGHAKESVKAGVCV